MITYTTLMGFAAGLGLILVSCLGYKLFYKKQGLPGYEGWALSLGSLGAILTALSLHMTLTWPLVAPERFKNFVFGEPNLVLGVLMLAAAFFLWRKGALLASDGKKGTVDTAGLLVTLRPISWIIFGLGLVLAACAVAGFQYEIFATAPSQEPLLGTLPKALVNIPLVTLYVIPAVGCLFAPLVAYKNSRLAMQVMGSAWFVTGLGWLLVAVLVYYTHIGMDFNFRA